MWSLHNENGSIHYLLWGSMINIGRRGKIKNQITLNDKTVSNLHASINIIHDQNTVTNLNEGSKVYIQDLRSSNGTFVRNENAALEKIDHEVPTLLKPDAQVIFGTNSVFRLNYEPLIVTTSQLSDESTKSELAKNVMTLGAQSSKNWSSKATLLVMNEIVLTIKAVFALASCVPIVTPNYLVQLLIAVKEKADLPEHKDFLPPLKEPTLNSINISFAPDPIRKNLFSGKTFYFCTKDSYSRMKNVVQLTGGKCVPLDKVILQKLGFSKDEVYIKSSDCTQSDIEDSLKEILSKKGLYLTPEYEIGLSLLHKSTERHCNSSLNINDILRPKSDQKINKEYTVIVPETQYAEEGSQMPIPSRAVIPETGENSNKSTKTSGASITHESDCGKTDSKSAGDVESVKDLEKNDILKRPQSFLCSKSEVFNNFNNTSKRKRSEDANEVCQVTKKTGSFKQSESMTLDETEILSKSHSLPSSSTQRSENSVPVFENLPVDISPIKSEENVNVKKKIRVATDIFATKSNIPVSTDIFATKSSDIPDTEDMVDCDISDNDISTTNVQGNMKSMPFEPYTLPSLRVNDSTVSSPNNDDDSMLYFKKPEIPVKNNKNEIFERCNKLKIQGKNENLNLEYLEKNGNLNLEASKFPESSDSARKKDEKVAAGNSQIWQSAFLGNVEVKGEDLIPSPEKESSFLGSTNKQNPQTKPNFFDPKIPLNKPIKKRTFLDTETPETDPQNEEFSFRIPEMQLTRNNKNKETIENQNQTSKKRKIAENDEKIDQSSNDDDQWELDTSILSKKRENKEKNVDKVEIKSENIDSTNLEARIANCSIAVVEERSLIFENSRTSQCPNSVQTSSIKYHLPSYKQFRKSWPKFDDQTNEPSISDTTNASQVSERSRLPTIIGGSALIPWNPDVIADTFCAVETEAAASQEADRNTWNFDKLLVTQK